MMRCCFKHGPSDGFTLTELAVVLVIVALLIGGMLMPLVAQNEIRRVQETQKTLNDAREALIGFAAAKGRLPCPAIATGNGIETPDGGGVCSLFDPNGALSVGFLPAATLGLTPVDNQGRLLDAWGSPIRYAVTTGNNSAFTKATPQTETLSGVGLTNLASDLIVCPTARSGGNDIQNRGTATADCPTGVASLTNTAVAILYSLGPNPISNPGEAGTGIDERHNPNTITNPSSPDYVAPDRVFVSHEPAPRGAANGEFDDIVIWLSPNILYNRMIAAGRLP